MTNVRDSLWCVTLVLLVSCSGASGQEAPGARVYRSAVRATVLVSRDNASGSGWVLDRSRKLIVTNYHVVGDDKEVKVVFPRFADGQVVNLPADYRETPFVTARVVKVDKERDLALLRVESMPARTRQLKLAQKEPEPGSRIHAIGNPALSDAMWVYTAGDVRSVYRKEWQVELPSKALLKLASRIVETQAPSNAGDSGGPLLNDRGELVGVQQGASARARLISYAISVVEVRNFLRPAPQAKKSQPAAQETAKGS
jgi:S1-C subfamily serine protease